MKLAINEIPLSKNKYVNLHWSKRKKYKEMMQWLIYKEYLPIPITSNAEGICYEKAKLTFDIYFKTNRRRDVHNYEGGGLISWIDALVDLKIIKDDCWDCIGQPIINFYIDKENPRTEITIKEVK